MDLSVPFALLQPPSSQLDVVSRVALGVVKLFVGGLEGEDESFNSLPDLSNGIHDTFPASVGDAIDSAAASVIEKNNEMLETSTHAASTMGSREKVYRKGVQLFNVNAVKVLLAVQLNVLMHARFHLTTA